MGPFQEEEAARWRRTREGHPCLVERPSQVEHPSSFQVARILRAFPEVVHFQSLVEGIHWGRLEVAVHQCHSHHATRILKSIPMELQEEEVVLVDTVAVVDTVDVVDFVAGIGCCCCNWCCHSEKAQREGEEAGKRMSKAQREGEEEEQRKKNKTPKQRVAHRPTDS